MFTFEWKFIGAEWQVSKKRFHEVKQAGGAMADFAVACFVNDCVVDCRLVKVNPLPSDI